MRTIPALLLVVLSAASAAAADGAYVDPTYGFFITPPGFADGDVATPVVFSGPRKNGFSPTVNVQVQPPSTREAYKTETVQQLEKAKMTSTGSVDIKHAGVDAWIVDYGGTMQERELRWRALVVFAADHTYLVTCTAPAADFAENEAAFNATLASFVPQNKPGGPLGAGDAAKPEGQPAAEPKPQP